MERLNAICDNHDHQPGLPHRELRGHILAQAIRLAETELRQHVHTDPERSLEVLHVAIEDAIEEDRFSGEWPVVADS